MGKRWTSRRRAKGVAAALFLVGLAVLSLTDTWWPGILLVVGLSIGLKQFLLGFLYDMGVTLFVFLGAFIALAFDIPWRIFLPILFSLGAVYVLAREFLSKEEDIETEAEKEEDLQREIEEDLKR